MRLHRLFGLLAAILMTATLLAPAAGAEPPFRLPDTITDNAGVLSDRQLAVMIGNSWSVRVVAAILSRMIPACGLVP